MCSPKMCSRNFDSILIDRQNGDLTRQTLPVMLMGYAYSTFLNTVRS